MANHRLTRDVRYSNVTADSINIAGSSAATMLGCVEAVNVAGISGIPDLPSGSSNIIPVTLNEFNSFVPALVNTSGVFKIVEEGNYRIAYTVNVATVVSSGTLGPAASAWQLGHAVDILVNNVVSIATRSSHSHVGEDATAIFAGLSIGSNLTRTVVRKLNAGDTVALQFELIAGANIAPANYSNNILGFNAMLRIERLT